MGIGLLSFLNATNFKGLIKPSWRPEGNFSMNGFTGLPVMFNRLVYDERRKDYSVCKKKPLAIITSVFN